MSYKNIWEKDGVYRKYTKCITGIDIINAMGEVHGHELFDSISYVINDFLDVTEMELTPVEIKTLAAIDKAAALSNPNIKIALVATKPTIQSMAEMYGDFMSESPYISEVFTELNEARKWIIKINFKERRKKLSLPE